MPKNQSQILEEYRPNAILNKKRYETIDIAKGLAIVLVVIGHYYTPEMPQFMKVAREIIYMFHMPLFMFVSGFLYAATYRPTSYRSFIVKKFKRLMVPYFVTSVLIIFIKLSMDRFMTVDHPVTSHDFIAILYSPAAGYFMWFIWSLWTMMLIIPLFNTLPKRMSLLAVALILYFYSGDFTEVFSLNQSMRYLVFFSAGTVVSDYMRLNGMNSFSNVLQYTVVVSFILLAWLKLEFHLPPIGYSIVSLLTAFSGIGMTLAISYLYLVRHGKMLRNVILSISTASYIIYLWHTTFQGFAKGLLNKLNYLDGSDLGLRFTVAMILVTACGIIFPMLLYRIVSKFRLTSFLFGLPFTK